MGAGITTTLAFLAPIVGAMAETFSRMVLVALCIYEAVGLLKRGMANQAEQELKKAVKEVSGL